MRGGPFLDFTANDVVGDVDVLFIATECDGAPVSWVYGPFLPRQN
jgi:hypothetical protein